MNYWKWAGISESKTRDVGLVGSYLLERLLPGVCAYVVIEGCCSGESSATISTFERSVAGVRHHVIPQIWWLSEGLGTMATLVGSEREEDSDRWGNKLLFLNKTSVSNDFCSITSVDIVIWVYYTQRISSWSHLICEECYMLLTEMFLVLF